MRLGRGVGSGLGKTVRSRPEGPVRPHARLQAALRRRPDAHRSAASRSAASTTRSRRSSAEVNVGDLEVFAAGAKVDEAALRDSGLVKGRYDRIKILGNGELTKAVTVTAHAFSKSAAAKIEKAGGKVVAPHGRSPNAAPAPDPRYAEPCPPSPPSRTSAKSPSSAAHPLHPRAARGLPHRRLRHDPRRRPERDERGHRTSRAAASSASSTCSRGGALGEPLDLRARHHAVRQREHHPAAADDGLQAARRAPQGGRAGPRKINQYTRYGTIVLSLVPGLRHRDEPRGDEQRGPRPTRPRSATS